MANPSLILWCDPITNKLYSGWGKMIQAGIPMLKQGDMVGVEIHWVNTNSFSQGMVEIPFPPSATVSLAIGLLDKSPTSGTFTLTFDGDTTDELSYNITATELQTALNGLASITAEGGVTVEKNNLLYRIVWNDKVVSTADFTCDTQCLYPTSQSSFAQAREGSLTSRRTVLFTLKQSAIAAQNTFVTVDPPEIIITNILASTWRVEISPQPKDGVFTLTYQNGVNLKTTQPIPINSSAAEIVTYLNIVENLQFSVSQNSDYSWDISCPSTVVNLTATSGLIGFTSVYGLLDLNTVEIEEFVSGVQYSTAFLEVQVDVSGEVQTLIQSSVIILNDLIDQSSFNVVPRGSVMPIDSVVRYDTSQALTSPQKTQARANIDALGLTDLATVEADIIDLDGRVTTLETDTGSLLPSVDEKAAMAGSTTPSSGNVFVTNSVLTTGLSGKAALVHTHVATDITDSTSYGRDILKAASVSAQRVALGLGTMAVENTTSWAPINSPVFTGSVTIPTGAYIPDYLPLAGGTMSGTLYSGDIVVGLFNTLTFAGTGIVFSDTTTQDTRVVRESQVTTAPSFDTTGYPDEVKVIDSAGTAYWVPARLA